MGAEYFPKYYFSPQRRKERKAFLRKIACFSWRPLRLCGG
jgi:hypothetical protein